MKAIMKIAFLSLLFAGIILLWKEAGRRASATFPFWQSTPTSQPSWRFSKTGSYIPLDRPIVGEKVTLEVARSRLPYPIPLPTYLPGDPKAAYLMEVWVSEAGSEDLSLALVYSVGITIIVHPKSPITNWSNLAEPPFTLINVSGYPGIGTDPGDQILDNGTVWHYPGSVTWQAGFLQFTVVGEYPLNELLKVAESLRLK